MIGNLVLDHDAEEWQLYILLRDILSIVLAKSYHTDTVLLLQTIITEHNELYIKCFSDTLKPKHHFLLHYPQIMAQVGPLCNIWSMRFESMHKEFKNISKTVTCRINLIHTFAIKDQLKSANMLLNSENIFDISITCGATEMVTVDALIKYTDSKNYKIVSVTSWISQHNITYKKNTLLKLGMSENNEVLIFGCIKQIFIIDNEYYFGCQTINTFGFDRHFYGYSIEFVEEFFLFPLVELVHKKKFYVCKIRDKNIINE